MGPPKSASDDSVYEVEERTRTKLPLGVDQDPKESEANGGPRQGKPWSLEGCFPEWNEQALGTLDWGEYGVSIYEEQELPCLPAQLASTVDSWKRPIEFIQQPQAQGDNAEASPAPEASQQPSGGKGKDKGKAKKGKEVLDVGKPGDWKERDADPDGKILPRMVMCAQNDPSETTLDDTDVESTSIPTRHQRVKLQFQLGLSESQISELRVQAKRKATQDAQAKQTTTDDAGETEPPAAAPPAAEEPGPVPGSDQPITPEGDEVDELVVSATKIVSTFSQSLDSDSPYLWEAIYPQDAAGRPCYNPGGRYVVKLWVCGKWRMVSVDDRIPIDDRGFPVIMASADRRELWPTILAKAIYKVHSLSHYSEQLAQRSIPGVTGTLGGFLGFVLEALTGWPPSLSRNISDLDRLMHQMRAANVPEGAPNHFNVDLECQRLLRIMKGTGKKKRKKAKQTKEVTKEDLEDAMQRREESIAQTRQHLFSPREQLFLACFATDSEPQPCGGDGGHENPDKKKDGSVAKGQNEEPPTPVKFTVFPILAFAVADDSAKFLIHWEPSTTVGEDGAGFQWASFTELQEAGAVLVSMFTLNGCKHTAQINQHWASPTGKDELTTPAAPLQETFLRLHGVPEAELKAEAPASATGPASPGAERKDGDEPVEQTTPPENGDDGPMVPHEPTGPRETSIVISLWCDPLQGEEHRSSGFVTLFPVSTSSQEEGQPDAKPIHVRLPRDAVCPYVSSVHRIPSSAKPRLFRVVLSHPAGGHVRLASTEHVSLENCVDAWKKCGNHGHALKGTVEALPFKRWGPVLQLRLKWNPQDKSTLNLRVLGQALPAESEALMRLTMLEQDGRAQRTFPLLSTPVLQLAPRERGYDFLVVANNKTRAMSSGEWRMSFMGDKAFEAPTEVPHKHKAHYGGVYKGNSEFKLFRDILSASSLNLSLRLEMSDVQCAVVLKVLKRSTGELVVEEKGVGAVEVLALDVNGGAEQDALIVEACLDPERMDIPDQWVARRPYAFEDAGDPSAVVAQDTCSWLLTVASTSEVSMDHDCTREKETAETAALWETDEPGRRDRAQAVQAYHASLGATPAPSDEDKSAMDAARVTALAVMLDEEEEAARQARRQVLETKLPAVVEVSDSEEVLMATVEIEERAQKKEADLAKSSAQTQAMVVEGEQYQMLMKQYFDAQLESMEKLRNTSMRQQDDMLSGRNAYATGQQLRAEAVEALFEKGREAIELALEESGQDTEEADAPQKDKKKKSGKGKK